MSYFVLKSGYIKMYSKAIVIKIVWQWYKFRQIDCWNEIERPEIGENIYNQLFFNKGTKHLKGKRKSFEQKMLEKLDIYVKKEIYFSPDLIPHIKKIIQDTS